jgi:hypothetical protein
MTRAVARAIPRVAAREARESLRVFIDGLLAGATGTEDAGHGVISFGAFVARLFF